MPIYDFVNVDTNEIYEEMMSINDMEEYLKNNSNIRRYFGNGLMLLDNVQLGRKRPSPEFFDVLDRIKRNNPGHTMNNTRWDRPREI